MTVEGPDRKISHIPPKSSQLSENWKKLKARLQENRCSWNRPFLLMIVAWRTVFTCLHTKSFLDENIMTDLWECGWLQKGFKESAKESKAKDTICLGPHNDYSFTDCCCLSCIFLTGTFVWHVRTLHQNGLQDLGSRAPQHPASQPLLDQTVFCKSIQDCVLFELSVFLILLLILSVKLDLFACHDLPH